MSTIADLAGSSGALWGAAALSLAAAAVYFVIGSPVVPADYKAPPKPVLLVAGAAYLVGGGLILFADDRLLLLGAALNPLVLAAYVGAAVTGHAAVDRLSLSGKVAQVALEILLVGLLLRSSEVSGVVG